MNSPTDVKRFLHRELSENAFISNTTRVTINPKGEVFDWFLDIKGVLLKPHVLNAVSELFWKHLRGHPAFQIGGIETVAIALLSGVVMKAETQGKSLNAWYMRKSRKIDGMQRMIEGHLTDEPIVLVDDALNSGKSIVRQIEVLEAMGKKVVEICVVVAFRAPSDYEYCTKRGIRIWSLFTLDDFPHSGGLAGFKAKNPLSQSLPAKQFFNAQWKFAPGKPNYFHVLPKSAPVVDDTRVYFGADDGALWALNQKDGSVAWCHRMLFGSSTTTGSKWIFSSPALSKGVVYFGGYDGNVYALDAETGKKKWVNLDADWIGSSPAIAEDLGTVFVGLEFGLFNKQGGIAALDSETGKRKWWHHVLTYMHSSPAYSKKTGIVVIGSEGGTVYAFNAKSGKPLWTYASGGPVKASLAFDEERNLVVFGSFDDHIHVLNTKTGALVHKIKTYKPIYSNPLVWNGKLYMGLLDKRIICADLDTGRIVWGFETHSRILASPIVTHERLYCGSNDGRLYELDPHTGKELGYFQATERIVNKIAYNAQTKRFFLPTYANELYCLERNPEK